MKTKKNRLLAVLCCGLTLTLAAPASAMHIRPAHHAERPSELFTLGPDGYERVEFVFKKFATTERFTVPQAGTYALSLTDMAFPRALRELGAAVTTADTKLVDIFGSGNVLFDMQPGRFYYLSIFARSFNTRDPGLFGLSLRPLQSQPAAVPVPAAAWLFGGGLVGMAGLLRRNRRE